MVCFMTQQPYKTLDGQAFADAYSVLENELSQFSDDCGPCSTTPFELLWKIIPSIDRDEWSLITGYITFFKVLVFWLHFRTENMYDDARCLIDSLRFRLTASAVTALKAHSGLLLRRTTRGQKEREMFKVCSMEAHLSPFIHFVLFHFAVDNKRVVL